MSTTIYDDCGCGSNNQQSGVRPPNLKCPPDMSTMLFRFVDRKGLGVVKGSSDLFKIDMSSFFLQLDSYSFFTMSLCPGETKQINVSNIANTGKRKQITEFDTDDLVNVSLAPGTTMDLVIIEDSVTIATLSNIPASNFTSISTAILSSSVIGDLITFSFSGTKFTFTTNDKGRYLAYQVTFKDGVNAPESLTGDITQTAERYPDLDHIKLLFAAAEYCSDCPTNNQYIEYAYASDYAINGANSTWKKSSKLIMLMGTNDVLDSDENLIETLWLKNTIDCKVNIHIIIGI